MKRFAFFLTVFFLCSFSFALVSAGSSLTCFLGKQCSSTGPVPKVEVCCAAGQSCGHYDYGYFTLPVCLPTCVQPNTQCFGKGLYNGYWNCCDPSACSVNSAGAPNCTATLPTTSCDKETIQCNGVGSYGAQHTCCIPGAQECAQRPGLQGSTPTCLANCSISEGDYTCRGTGAWRNFWECCGSDAKCVVDFETGQPTCVNPDEPPQGECVEVYVTSEDRSLPITSCDHYNFIEGTPDEKANACVRDCADAAPEDVQHYLSESSDYRVQHGACAWDGSRCYFSYRSELVNNPSLNSECMLLHSRDGICGESDDYFTSYFSTIALNGTSDGCTALTCGNTECERNIVCPRAVQLPFFGWVGFVVVIVVIAFIYLFLKRRR